MYVWMLFILLNSFFYSDMSPQHEIFSNAIEFFSADQEDVRAAASFAAGGLSQLSLFHTS